MSASMPAAKVMRRPMGARTRARETYSVSVEPETLFEGDLAGAIAAARAIPVGERLDVSIETEAAIFGPDDFDLMTPDISPLRDFDMVHGAGIVRVEKGALERLLGDRPGSTPPMSILSEHLDTVSAILNHKRLTGEVEEIGGKRAIRITAADVDAA
jgi:hypothetical protein